MLCRIERYDSQGIYNRKTSRMTCTEKKYIKNEDGNIIQVSSTSIILLIFMSDIYFSVYV